jgi:hypothetical protein
MHSNYYKDCRCNTTIDHLCCTTGSYLQSNSTCTDVTTVTATDACGTPTVTFVSDVVNLVGCTETTTRTYRATDPCGNTAQCTQTITRTVDVTPPSITCAAPPVLTCKQTVPAPDVTTVTALMHAVLRL